MTRAAVLRLTALLLAALFCAGAGWFARQAEADEDLAFARERDAVLTAGSRHIARLNTLDTADVTAGLDAWLAATTGPLHAELARTHKESAEVMTEVGTTAHATVSDAAVTHLDTHTGTARLIATVQVDITPRTGPSTTERKRFDAGLATTDDGWKLTSLTALTVPGSVAEEENAGE